MRYLGVDYGTKRIGLAVGEDSPFFVEALRTIEADGPESAAVAIAAAADEEGAETIVVGMPYALPGGDMGITAEAIREMIGALETKTGLQVVTEDERMTTALVERMRRESGGLKRKFDKDAAAAAAILETYIEKERRSGDSGEKR